MVNLVVNDMAASLGFYRRWGSQCLRVRTRLARTFS